LRRALSHDARLELAGLTGEAVAGLVAILAGGEPDSELMRLAGDAAGNPLYITELIAALTRSARVTITGTGAAAVTAGLTPGSLSAAIADRLGFVTDPEREVLRAAALLGVDFAVADLAIVLNRGVADLVGFLDEARAAGVLAASGKRFRFRHPLIRAALYEEMPEAVRAAWHREAGRVLAEAGAPVDRVARQLLLAVGGPDGTPEPAAAAEPMDEWMLTWLAGTAGPLVSQAPQVAAQLLRQAVASSRPGPQHGHLAARFADALYRMADTTGAERVARLALAHAVEPDLLMDLHWTLVQCVMREGRFAESLAILDQALALPGLSARHRARLLILAARTHSNFGSAEAAARVAASALEAASEADDSWAMGWALHMMALVTSTSGRMTEALPLYDRALTATQADPALTDLRLLTEINLAITLGSLDRYEEGLAAARQARDFADQVGATLRLGQARGALAQLLYQMGRWDDALAEMQSMPEDLKEDGAVCTELGIAAVISFHRGDVPGARRHLATVAPYAARLKPRLVASLALARSLDYEYAGALPEALAVLTREDSPEDIEETEEVFGDVVRLAIATGDLAEAHAFAGQAAALAAGSEIPHRQAAALYCRSLLDGDAPLLLAAAERYEDASRPLMRAKALEAAAEHFFRADDHSQARAAFTAAVTVYVSLGAAAYAARLDAAFRVRGIRRGPRAKHRQARTGWDSLTPTEIKIAAFVAEGLSNPEIAVKLVLSRRTVATHVSHILRKLDVPTRIDIARESALRTLAPRLTSLARRDRSYCGVCPARRRRDPAGVSSARPARRIPASSARAASRSCSARSARPRSSPRDSSSTWARDSIAARSSSRSRAALVRSCSSSAA
jgi:DNA-binding CsgD family transcriptional regulator